MGVIRDGDTEDASELTYPSPGADAVDSGPFYHSKARDGAAGHQDQSGQPAKDEVQVQAQEHEQAPIITQTPSSPQHNVSRPANLEELQLAAQLGQGLAAAPIMPLTDPNMNVDGTNLRRIMPRPHTDASDQDNTTNYLQETSPPDAIDQSQMPVPVGSSVPPQYSMGDDIPPRKRSKVSRACDECRRKKIKCDAQSDTGETPCSGCARSNTPCLFSRVPQKRGPSKGYIKELADRIHSIENKLESDGNLSQDEIEKLFALDRSRQSNGAEDSSRKRPFSSISTGDFAMPTTLRQTPWGSGPRHVRPTPLSGADSDQECSNASLAPRPNPIRADDCISRQPAEVTNVSAEDAEEISDIDDQAYQHFLTSVQPVYPVLPYDMCKMQALLSESSPAVRTAFNLTLPYVGQASAGDTKVAGSILHEWESSDAPRSRATDIVHAQTLLMLIVDSDWRAAPSLPFLLARGIALANTMKLWKLSTVEAGPDNDSNEHLCVRIWWSLVLMDRWHAAGTGNPAQVPERSVVIPSGLVNNVGEVCFYLLRLSKLLNRISFVISTLQAGATAADPFMAEILTDYIENYREDLPAHVDAAAYPMIHLAYWHCRLLVTLLTPEITPKEIMWPTKELVHLLSVSAEVKSPLINHFVSLVTMALGELIKADATREEIVDIIKEIAEKPSGGHWDGVRDKLTEIARPTSSSGAPDTAASQSLQHLADLATAHEGSTSEEASTGTTLATGYREATS